MKKIYHVEIKRTENNEHHYFTNLKSAFSQGFDLGVSKGKMDRYAWEENNNYYENQLCVIRKSVITK